MTKTRGKSCTRSGRLLAIISSLVACSSDSELEDRAERWETAQPDRYVVQTCALGITPPGCIRAAIEAGDPIASEERVFAGHDWEPIEVPLDPLKAMFDRVRQGDADGCELESVAYDDSFGFVERYELTCEGVDAGRWVACFEKDSLDLAVCDVEPAM